MTEQDREMVSMIVENTISGILRTLAQDAAILAEKVAAAERALVSDRIDVHLKTCPWNEDYQRNKIKVTAFIVGAAAGGGGFGAAVATILSRML